MQMRALSLSLLVVTALISSQRMAHACVIRAEQDLPDVLIADAVIVGTVLKYEIVTNTDTGNLSNYALFTVQVKDILRGEVPMLLQFSWNNSTFGEPAEFDMANDLVFALQKIGSRLPPLRSGSSYIPPAPRRDMMTVLQAPCSAPFIFKTTSNSGKAVLGLLGAKGYDKGDAKDD